MFWKFYFLNITLSSTAGYNYFGNERMYSGITGREFEVDIFIGNIYYQRLRHMVADKFQVRTTGPIDQLTHQPVQVIMLSVVFIEDVVQGRLWCRENVVEEEFDLEKWNGMHS